MSLAMATSLGFVAGAQDAAAGAPPAAGAGGQQATIQGLVIGRDGPTMSVRTADTPRLTVVLSDSTQATEKGGFLGLDRKHPGITQLAPGLQVKIEGTYDPDHKLVARKIIYTRSSLTTAQQIDAGLNPTAQQVAQAQDQLKSDRRDIEQSQTDITKNSSDITTTQQGLATTTAATQTNTQDIGKANQRFGTMDQYDTKGSITVTFANGKSTISKKDMDQLTDFAKSAADTPGYMIQVQGYASATGPAALNQKLSSERADAVLAVIQQTGAVPLTRILAPAAMGITDQVADNHTRSGQAQNRRVVVTILVNKGITGGGSTGGL
jgi:outer membrane protein OmpA-like peptidoglycan-associated protein